MTAFVPTGDRDPDLGFIVHPTAALFPLMGAAELAELAADIKANGQHDPIVTFKGVLIDGRNRLRACRLAGVDEKYAEWKRLDSAELVHTWILSKNLHRRHLTESQRAMIAGGLAKRRKGANQHRGAEDGGIPLPSQAEAAAQLNVSVDSVKAAATVLAKGAPELVDAVKAGTVAVSRAADIARAAPDNAVAQREALAQPRRRKAKAPPAPSAEPTAPETGVESETDVEDQDEPPAPPTSLHPGVAAALVRDLHGSGGALRDVWVPVPAGGDGAIADALVAVGARPAVLDIDPAAPALLVHPGLTVDFHGFALTDTRFPGLIVAEPPADLAEPFLDKALRLVEPGGLVAFVLPLEFWVRAVLRPEPPVNVRPIAPTPPGAIPSAVFFWHRLSGHSRLRIALPSWGTPLRWDLAP